MVKFTKRHKITINHLRYTRNIGKYILQLVPESGSAIISHKFEVTTIINPSEKMISTVEILPAIRMYKKEEIIEDESLLTEEEM